MATFIPFDRTQAFLMLALLVYSHATGIFSSRRIERATHRDIGMRFVAANTHPDHDTIAVFRQTNKAAFEVAFLEVLLLTALAYNCRRMIRLHAA